MEYRGFERDCPLDGHGYFSTRLSRLKNEARIDVIASLRVALRGGRLTLRMASPEPARSSRRPAAMPQACPSLGTTRVRHPRLGQVHKEFLAMDYCQSARALPF